MICLCLTAPTNAANSRILAHYRSQTAMVEFRIDLLEPAEQAGFVPWVTSEAALAGLPAILTVRLPADGGKWEGDEAGRRSLYRALLETCPRGTFAWVDMEHGTDWPEVEAACVAHGARILRSAHNFGPMMAEADIMALIDAMAQDGAMPKYAAMCASTRDLLVLARIGARLRDQGRQAVLLGMGAFGLPTRILSRNLSSPWTYSSASADVLEAAGAGGSAPAAPGHLDPATLADLYQHGELAPGCPVFGVVGNPVMHSQSPAFHNPRLQAARTGAVYLPFQVDELESLRELADMWNCRGFSVTVPHKEGVRAWLVAESEGVRATGACNTLLRRTDGWHGENTDIMGFVEPLEAACGARHRSLAGAKVLVVGAGGAARAAVHALRVRGAEVSIVNRTFERAEALAAEHPPARALRQEALAEAGAFDVVVNTTSLGMAHSAHEGQDALPDYAWRGTELAYDIIYTPALTPFLARAERAGCMVLNGQDMFRIQAGWQSRWFLEIASGN